MYQMEEVKQCPVCGGNSIPYKSNLHKGVFVKTDQCRSCEMIYQNPRMTREAMRDYYRRGNYVRDVLITAPILRNRANRVSQTLKGFELTPRRVLDYGCASGFLLRNMQEDYGSVVVGIDPNPINPVVDSIVSSRDEVEGKFDLVLCVHTLEHFYDPLDELKWMNSVLDVGGTMYIEIPQDENIILPHTFLYRRGSLSKMLDRVGLKYFITKLNDHNILVMAGEGYDMFRVEYVQESETAYTYDGIYH